MARLVINKYTPLSPITEEELMEYVYFILYHCDYMSQVGHTGKSPDRYADVMDDSGRQLVLNSYLWQEFKFVWEYADQGLHGDEINSDYACDLVSSLYMYAALGEAVLDHDGQFGNEGASVSHAGTVILYKFLARIKLDFKWDIGFEVPPSCHFPMADEIKLTTVEYALLAGFASIGPVRNEVSNKADPLKAEKVGNTLLISIDEARKRLPRTRKYIPTQGVTHG